jgi:hypothetical protein
MMSKSNKQAQAEMTRIYQQAINERPKTNKQAQADFKARMRKAGMVPVHLWIQRDRKPILEAFARTLRETAAPK